eukprot:jgi/Mesvir1/11555/Mv17929-RA.1
MIKKALEDARMRGGREVVPKRIPSAQDLSDEDRDILAYVSQPRHIDDYLSLSPLLAQRRLQAEPRRWHDACKKFAGIPLMVAVILCGTTNRVAFRIMQYPSMNYAYFNTQFLSLMVWLIFSAVVAIKLVLKTGDITDEHRAFPKWKFAVIGLLDALQGILICVAGKEVPGMMQNLLLQGLVPTTMLFSLFMLKPEDLRWSHHFRTFYRWPQYLGAIVVLSGIVISAWPSLVDGNRPSHNRTGPLLFDLLFFSACIPTALSSVLKEIMFNSTEDMDVWYVNAWIAFFQTLLGLPNAFLAARMMDIRFEDIPRNVEDGFTCMAFGENHILPNVTYSFGQCDATVYCGQEQGNVCCDSCDGSIPTVSSVSHLTGMVVYLSANVLYNVVLVLVIKHKGAAFMYIASTAILPLASVAFTFKSLMGPHSDSFNMYTGIGLGVTILGLIIYRFSRKADHMASDSDCSRAGSTDAQMLLGSYHGSLHGSNDSTELNYHRLMGNPSE